MATATQVKVKLKNRPTQGRSLDRNAGVKLVIVKSNQSQNYPPVWEVNTKLNLLTGMCEICPNQNWALTRPMTLSLLISFPSARKRVNELKSWPPKRPRIILAADEDREGEAIAWHINILVYPNNKR